MDGSDQFEKNPRVGLVVRERLVYEVDTLFIIFLSL